MSSVDVRKTAVTSANTESSRVVLLVEDEKDLDCKIASALEQTGYLVRSVSMVSASNVARANGASILIRSRFLRGSDSLENLKLMRRQGIKIPVLMISAQASVDEIVQGLRAGADDYLVQPFCISELVARVDAMLRRLGEIKTTRLCAGDLEVDLVEQAAFKGSERIKLLRREYELLEYFLYRPGQLITRAMLLKNVWQFRSDVESNVIDTHISNLRRKIDDVGLPSRIVNVRGRGFILIDDERASLLPRGRSSGSYRRLQSVRSSFAAVPVG
jgi:two-component system, OmpR family, response regulator